METLFNVQPILPSKNKIVPDLSEHDCTSKFNHEYYYDLLFFLWKFRYKIGILLSSCFTSIHRTVNFKIIEYT
jgi:hypothetical protein